MILKFIKKTFKKTYWKHQKIRESCMRCQCFLPISVSASIDPCLEKYQIEASKWDSINYKEILSIYDKIAPNHKKLVLTHRWDLFILEFVEGIRYMDYKQDSVDYNSQGYIDFLNEIKSLCWPSNEALMWGDREWTWWSWRGRKWSLSFHRCTLSGWKNCGIV